MTNPVYITGENCSSFELRRLSKGYAWNIKVYNPDIEQGFEIVKKINKQAADEYGKYDMESD